MKMYVINLGQIKFHFFYIFSKSLLIQICSEEFLIAGLDILIEVDLKYTSLHGSPF